MAFIGSAVRGELVDDCCRSDKAPLRLRHAVAFSLLLVFGLMNRVGSLSMDERNGQMIRHGPSICRWLMIREALSLASMTASAVAIRWKDEARVSIS